MVHYQLYLLEENERTRELYFRLPAPFDNFIIGPPRDSDATELVKIMNKPEVYHWLSSPHNPYTLEHAQQFIQRVKARSDSLIHSLTQYDGEVQQLADGCPIDTIREIKSDGTDEYVGNIGIQRCHLMEYSEGATVENKAKLEEVNDRLSIGDPNIVWSLGNYLAPEYHRRGIMPTAVEVLMKRWMIPKMGVRRMLVTAYDGNYGSVRVLQKNGFRLRETRQDCAVVRGELRGMHVLDWEYKEN